MDDTLNTIRLGDCIEGMNEIPAGSADLVFADPPFNIGYDYDVYDDAREHEHYLDWSNEWIPAVFRVLKPNGTFWLAIGDEYAAELKLASRRVGFHCRSWVIWYYTFGVNCARKFTRSHAHLFHFVKDPADFTFRDDDLDNRVPSARELVYNDKRANPKGRLPDDTWIIRPANAVGELTPDDDATWSPHHIEPPADNDRTFTLRPQDLEECFQAEEDTWYFPRVAGTFKERAGFHGCQMPEQLLGRIIRVCSNPGDLVLDPFSGSATTLAVAKKLGRKFLGFDVSQDYVQYGLSRLEGIRVGDRLDGSPEPLKSAPRTRVGGRGEAVPSAGPASKGTPRAREERYAEVQRELTQLGIVEAFRLTHGGFSADRVVADPHLNGAFVGTCEKLGLVGEARTWNTSLFRLRKAGRLSHIPTRHRTRLTWEECDRFMFASEIAWQSMLDAGEADSLDGILCDPVLASDFDRRAQQFAPGFTSLEYRWAALTLRKAATVARTRAESLTSPTRFGKAVPLTELDVAEVPESSGLYILSEDPTRRLYAGETMDLRGRLAVKRTQLDAWLNLSESLLVQTVPLEHTAAGPLAWQCCLVRTFQPRLNSFELRL